MKHRKDPTEPERLRAIHEQSLQALFEKDHLSQFGKMVKGLIHNINGPLQNLSMLVEMLNKGQDQMDGLIASQSRDFSQKWEAISARQRQRFQLLIQQITSLAEIQRDFMVLLEMEKNQQRIDLNLIIEKMANVFKADLFFKHQVDIELRLERSLPHVAIHGRDLIPALMHIFQNAITAMKESPRKKLIIESLRENGDFIRIVFRDSGCGLSSEGRKNDLYKLFYSRWPESFAARGYAEKHHGFGLYAVRQLLGPYGAKFRLERGRDETLAIVLIPVIPKAFLDGDCT
jgi:signal transduction histidine kinase